MDLLKRAGEKAQKLRERGETDRAEQLEGAIKRVREGLGEDEKKAPRCACKNAACECPHRTAKGACNQGVV
jgi:hypothetical protein